MPMEDLHKKHDKQLKELIEKIRDYHIEWSDWTMKEMEELYKGNGEYLCNYHLNIRKKKFKKGTIIVVVSPKHCPQCDVDTLGLYS